MLRERQQQTKRFSKKIYLDLLKKANINYKSHFKNMTDFGESTSFAVKNKILNIFYSFLFLDFSGN